MKIDGDRKNYIIDTNVLLHDPNCIQNFKGNNVILPMVVLEELDSLKTKDGLVGCQARQVARQLSMIFDKKENKSIKKGIPLENGIILKVQLNGYHNIKNAPEELSLEKNDNRIILTALNIKQSMPDQLTILVSKDICMRLKASSLGIISQDYETDKINKDQIYHGYIETVLKEKDISKIYEGGLPWPKKLSLLPNQFVSVKTEESNEVKMVAKYCDKKLKPLEYEHSEVWGLRPLNIEQKMALELLMDDKIQFVSITGGAGSGKTIMATAVALEKVVEQRQYRKIVFVRPVVAAGEDIGYLPGSEEDKLRPWMGSFYDAIESLSRNKTLKKTKKQNNEDDMTVDYLIETLQRNGMIEMKTFTYMRGRTLSDAIVIVDEAQEITPHIAKLMLTRAGQNTKFIFLGDPTDNQIDNVLVDARSNGLVYLTEHMKGYDITGHITLKHVERSNLAKIAEKCL